MMKSKLLLSVALVAFCGAAQAATVVVPARAVVVARPAPAPARVAPTTAKPAPAKTAPVMEHDANVSNMPPKTPVIYPTAPVRSNAVNNKCDDERRKAGDCR